MDLLVDLALWSMVIMVTHGEKIMACAMVLDLTIETWSTVGVRAKTIRCATPTVLTAKMKFPHTGPVALVGLAAPEDLEDPGMVPTRLAGCVQ